VGESPNPIDVELAAEKAAALGRSGRRLRAALEKLRKFDAGERGRAARRDRSAAAARKELVELAGEAFWSYIVQRESLGLYDADTIAGDYGVPPEVRTHMKPRLRNSER
jgi:hypothetical protein